MIESANESNTNMVQKKEKPPMNDLMTIADIAEMAHCSTRHVRDVIVKLPGFPDEAPLSTPRNRLWVRAEVRSYVHRKAAKPAQIPHNSLQPA